MFCILHVALLEQDTIKKNRMIDNVAKLNMGDSKDYEVEAIRDIELYARKSESYFLLSFYYLVL